MIPDGVEEQKKAGERGGNQEDREELSLEP